MDVMINIFLNAEERKRFDALSAEFTKGFTVTDETSKAYETDYELVIRANMADLSTFPAFKQMFDDLRAGKKTDVGMIKEIPEEALPEVMFTIGARGIAMLMDEAFDHVESAKDMEGVAGLSVLRHDILTSNSQVLSR